jgi:hypothetical protein
MSPLTGPAEFVFEGQSRFELHKLVFCHSEGVEESLILDIQRCLDFARHDN